MSEHRALLLATATALLSRCAPAAEIESAGFGELLAAGDWGDALAVIRLAGEHDPASPLPAIVLRGALGDATQTGAAARVALTAGALARILALSIEHANTRQQFGRPLGKFQAVQQNLAILAAEAGAVAAATRALADALDRHDAAFETAAAKLRANRAIGIGTAIAHQVHGAIGFTRDHPLHRFTGALLRWRGECGNDRFWADRLGALATALGPDGLWPELTRCTDPRS